MRHFLIVILFLSFQYTEASVFAPSYEQKLKKFNQEMALKDSKFSAEDKAIMKNAGEYLAKSLPNPGIHIGEKAPNFVLNNAFGKTIRLKDELKKGPVVLVFYRGSWCPYCNLHLRSLQESLPMIKRYGARLITITPQKPDKSVEQLKNDGFRFEVLSDQSSKVMRDYKLYFEIPNDLMALYKKFGINIEDFNGQGRNSLPVPGSFVIDQNGIVQAMQASTDYKLRMEPQAMIDALKTIHKENNKENIHY